MPSNRTRTPVVGPLRVTTPLRAKPLIHIFPLGTQSAISTFAPDLTGVAVSTRHPPTLVWERLPQIGILISSTRSSTATKHLIRGWRRRSLPKLGLNRSGNDPGSNGGVADAGVGTDSGADDMVCVSPAAPVPALISRMAVSRAASRFSGGASR